MTQGSASGGMYVCYVGKIHKIVGGEKKYTRIQWLEKCCDLSCNYRGEYSSLKKTHMKCVCILSMCAENLSNNQPHQKVARLSACVGMIQSASTYV